MTNIWATILQLTDDEFANIGFDVCQEIKKETKQNWFINRLVGDINKLAYDGYSLIKNSDESYIVLVTPNEKDLWNNEKMEYIFSMCKVFNKKIISYRFKNGRKYDWHQSLIVDYDGVLIEIGDLETDSKVVNKIVDQIIYGLHPQ